MSCKRIGENKYRIVVELGFDIFGKRKRKTEIFNGNYKDATLREAELIKKYYHKGERIIINDLTFEEYSNIFLKKYCLDNVSNVTIKSYKQLLSKINPLIGDIKLKKINTYTLDSLYHRLKKGEIKSTRNPETLLHYYRLINVMFAQAVKWQLVDNNPNQNTIKPKRMKSERNFYDIHQIKKLYQCLQNENIKYKALITLAVDSGARRSEICALKWNDIDFNNRTMLIDNSLKVVNGVVDEEGIKNSYSCREITLSNYCIDILKEYKKWQDEYKKKNKSRWINENRVFTSINGTHIHPDTCTDILNKIIKKYNLPKITFHDLRHSSTSMLIHSGVDIKLVSERLGHSNTNTTMNIYTHTYKGDKYKSADAIDNIMDDIS